MGSRPSAPAPFREICSMRSHHFLGSGPYSADLRELTADSAALVDYVAGIVVGNGLDVVARQIVPFDNGGLTVVWVLAESHLVLHYWGEEGFATLDLHICDYRASNEEKARRLVTALNGFCFDDGAGSWRETHLDYAASVRV